MDFRNFIKATKDFSETPVTRKTTLSSPDRDSNLDLPIHGCLAQHETSATPDRDSNLDLPVIGSLVYCENSALDHAATEETREKRHLHHNRGRRIYEKDVNDESGEQDEPQQPINPFDEIRPGRELYEYSSSPRRSRVPSHELHQRDSRRFFKWTRPSNITILPGRVIQRVIQFGGRMYSHANDLASLVTQIHSKQEVVFKPWTKVYSLTSGYLGQLGSTLDGERNMIPWAPGVPAMNWQISVKVSGGMSVVSEETAVVAPPLPPLPPPAPEISLHDTVILILQSAATFRRNIVTVLGYVLNNRQVRLSSELHLALQQIYTSFRLRQIRVYEILPILMQMSVQTPEQQCLTLLTSMIKVSPNHIQSSIQLAIQSLNNYRLSLNTIFRPGGGPLVVNFLEGIDATIVNLIVKPPNFGRNIEMFVPQNVSVGYLFGCIIEALSQGSLQLTQPLIGVLLLHIQTYKFTAEAEEGMLYLSDLFFQGREELNFVLNQLEKQSLKNPHDLINTIVWKLGQQHNIDTNIRDIIDTILDVLTKKPEEALYDEFHRYLQFASIRDINYSILFKVISPGDFPPGVIYARDVLLKSIVTEEININQILTGFVPHDYTDPRDLLLAILDRIRKRAVLPAYLVNPVSDLYVHFKLKMISFNLVQKHPRGYLDILLIFESLKSPSLPENVRRLAQQILELLGSEDIDWVNVLRQFPFVEYSRPRHLFVSVVRHLTLTDLVQSRTLIGFINEFLKLLDSNGEPLECPVAQCPSQLPVIYITPPITTTTTTTPPPPVTTTVSPELRNIDRWVILQALGPQSMDDPNLKPLIELFFSNRLMDLIVPSLDVSMYRTSGELLKAILEIVLQSRQLEQQTLAVIQYWLGRVNLNGYGASEVKYNVPNVTLVVNVNMNTVLQALDLIRIENEGNIMAYSDFVEFISKQFNNVEYLQSFQFQHLKTRGEFLVNLLKHIQSFNIEQKYKTAINILSSYVTFTGPGALPIDVTS
uniref:Uncharacterized protein n=1 Tax=Timema bartmani TaxID=61472 RepID=A0A7R9F4W4_9NEOP|nr:unnamed protein product [Timema bartmani]